MKTVSFPLLTSLLFSINSAMALDVPQKDNKALHVIKWKIAHAPKEYFEHTAKEFKKRIERRTEGRVKVEIESALFDKVNHDFQAQVDDVRSNKNQVSQVYLSQLYKVQPDFKVLNLPFLFKNNLHVDKVVDGKIGKELLASMKDDKIEGLSYTYSGGFINVVSVKPLEIVEDFKNLAYRAFSGEVNSLVQSQMKTDVTNEYIKNKDGTYSYLTIDKMLERGLISAGDATSNDARWATSIPKNNQAKYLTKTEHFVLFTALIINKEFISSLSQKDGEIVRSTAKEVSKIERDYVVRDGLKAEIELAKAGVSVSSFPQSERMKLKKRMVKEIYPIIESQVSKGLIIKVRDAYTPKVYKPRLITEN